MEASRQPWPTKENLIGSSSNLSHSSEQTLVFSVFYIYVPINPESIHWNKFKDLFIFVHGPTISSVVYEPNSQSIYWFELNGFKSGNFLYGKKKHNWLLKSSTSGPSHIRNSCLYRVETNQKYCGQRSMFVKFGWSKWRAWPVNIKPWISLLGTFLKVYFKH